MKKENSILKGQTYTSRFLEAGLVQYEDSLSIIKQENLAKIAEKFKGVYVVIEHQDLTEEDREEIVGYVSKVWMQDGWAWCDVVITSQEAIDLINEKGYSVSCAYSAKVIPTAGTYHNIAYDNEIVDCLEAIHLAIVANPRYEDALILKNSIKEKVMTIFKFKKEEKKNSIKTKELEIENALFEIEEGKTIPLNDMVEVYKNAKEEEKRKEEEENKKVNAEDELEIDGKLIKVKDLVSAYKNKMKKNEEDEEDKKKENEEDDKKKEEEMKKNEEKEKKEKEEVKKNSKDFEEIKAAKAKFENSSEARKVKISTDISQFALGKSLYGSSK